MRRERGVEQDTNTNGRKRQERALDEADAEAAATDRRLTREEFMQHMRGYLDELSRQSDTAV